MISARLEVGPTRWERRTDVIVVGSGAAGLSAALALIAGDHRITLITKGRLGDGSTAWAQGGLAAVIDPTDSLRGHVDDTIAAGAGLCEPAAVTQLATAAPHAIRRLAELGAVFDRRSDGSLALGLEGGHRARRIVHAGGDASGAEVVRVLTAAVRRAAERGRAVILENALAVDALLAVDGGVCGLAVIDGDGDLGELRAHGVILATGGIGQAWPVTSNPATATGDGLALALRAGALVRDMEFVQFHPTVLVPRAESRRPGERAALISEAMRGEGARLVDLDGTPIMPGLHPAGDLAPRDVVAAAMHRRMMATDNDHVLLDATGFGASTWREHFPTILALCIERGIDPRVRPMPVAPAAHYSCGGVLADLDGTTTVPGLYAIGELASTGVQGANRLASNGVTEALIAGGRVARLLLHTPPQRRIPAERATSAVIAGGLRAPIVAATGRGCGVLRDGESLEATLGALAALGDAPAAPSAAPPAALALRELRAAVEATNLHAVATVVATGALHRTESRGAHRRSDHPEPRSGWCRHQLLALSDGEVQPVSDRTEQAA